jgi:serine/threonine protein phosphatase PrpC
MLIDAAACGRTDAGKVRQNNEDAWLIVDLSNGKPVMKSGPAFVLRVGPRGLLLAVCDGVGGAAAGEVASSLALDALRRTVLDAAVGSDPQETLRWGVDSANREVWMAAQEPERKGMATTLAAVLVLGAHAYLAAVGDSRVYVLRGGRLVQLTHDQSYVQLLVDAGRLTSAEAARSRQDNVILQAVGKEPEVAVALEQLALQRGDRLLVCSDGLWSKLADEEMARIVDRAPGLEAACADLIRGANDRGGEDNITVVLAAFDGESLPAAEDRPAPGAAGV